MIPFVLLKGLSFLPFGGLLKNPKVIIGIVLIAVLAFAYWKWKSSIEEAAYNAIFTQQAEEHLERQRKNLEQTQKLIEESNAAVLKSQKQRESLLRDIEAARDRTRNVRSEDNGEVAPVLRDALEFIRQNEGAPEAPERTLGDTAKDAVDKATGAVRGAVKTGNDAIDAWRNKSKP